MLFYTHTPLGFPEQKREPRGALPLDEDLLTWRTVDLGLTPGNSGVPADIRPIWADIYLFGHGERVFRHLQAERRGWCARRRTRR